MADKKTQPVSTPGEDGQPNDIVAGDAPFTPPDDDASDEAKADYAYRRWKLQSDHYSGYLRTWARSVLFLLGKQWLQWNRTTRQYTPERNVPKWRQQPVSNFVFAVYRTAVAKLTKQEPAFDCVPPSGDSDDRESALLAGALLKYWWRCLKMPAILKRTLGWLLCTGNAYLLVHWDPKTGKVMPLKTSATTPEGEDVDDVPADENGEPKLKEDGTPDTDADPHRVQEGEVAVSVIPSWFVRFNPDADSPEEADEWFIADVMGADHAEKLFNMDPHDIEGGVDEEIISTIDMLQAASTGSSSNYGLWSGTDNSTAKGRRCLVIRYYKKPDAEYPDGRHWVQINKQMAVKEKPLPYGFWPPAVSLQDVTVPGQTLAMGLIPQVIPLQEQYNALNGQVMEHNNIMARGGKWVVDPADSNVNITSDPGQVIASKGYREGRPPTQVTIKGLPAEVLNERQRIINDLQMVSAFSELALGKKPEGVSSGRGFLVLQEQVDSVFSPTMFVVENALEEVGRRFLVLAKQYYREERTIRIRGEDGKWEYRSFMQSDLSDSADVQVQIGSSFPWSKSARQDMVLTLIQALPGLVTNPDGSINKQELARYINTGGIQAFESENDPDEDEIDREHAQFEAVSDGEKGVPQPEFWQDHAKHYVGHCDFMKRDYGRFLRWKPQAQQLFLQHIEATRQAIAEGIQQMMPPAGAQSGPPGTPQPGQPGGAQPPGPLSLVTNQPGSGQPSADQQAQLTPTDFRSAAA